MCYDASAGWSSLVARRAHNPKVVSSNLTPATISLSPRPESWIPAFFLRLAAGYLLGRTQSQGSRSPLPLSTVHINGFVRRGFSRIENCMLAFLWLFPVTWPQAANAVTSLCRTWRCAAAGPVGSLFSAPPDDGDADTDYGDSNPPIAVDAFTQESFCSKGSCGIAKSADGH